MFEPGPLAIARLKAKNIPGAKLETLALSDSAGTAKFKVYHGENSHINTLVTDGTVGNERGFEVIEVQTELGDTYCKTQGINHIDFLKVDVEGAGIVQNSPPFS